MKHLDACKPGQLSMRRRIRRIVEALREAIDALDLGLSVAFYGRCPDCKGTGFFFDKWQDGKKRACAFCNPCEKGSEFW